MEDLDIKILIISKIKVGYLVGVNYVDGQTRYGRVNVLGEDHMVVQAIAPIWKKMGDDHIPHLEIQDSYIPYVLIKEFTILE